MYNQTNKAARLKNTKYSAAKRKEHPMKKTALLMALIMLFSCMSLQAFAEESVIKESASGFYYIEANGDQPRLSAASREKFFQVDGLWFKDMNGNSTLDVYEDWRQDTEARVSDLLSKMTLQQKAGSLIFSGIAGKNGIVVTDLSGDLSSGSGVNQVSYIGVDSEAMKSHEVVINVNDVNYCPMPFQVQDMYVTTYIAALTGTPKDQLDLLNAIQKLGEDTELGIPIVFSGDRTYNTWGGMIDAAHYALSISHDEELVYNLLSEYAKESVAIGYHQVFHGYGNEIGSWYGDNPSYIAKMSAIETRAYEDNGFNSHSKHFIARGGRNAYVNAKSPADLIDSWKIGWKAVVDAGTQWIMTNNNVGVTPGLQGYMDKETYKILREELGYDGIVCLDWPLDIDRMMGLTGITTDGIDVSTLSAEERYALILNVGVDMFSACGVIPGTDTTVYPSSGLFRALPDLIVNAQEHGLIDNLDQHVARVLRNKFSLGIFENPYRDWEEALALISPATYTAESAIPMNNAEIENYRRPEIRAMEEQLMVESSVLLKNDGILPLTADKKLYIASNNGNITEADTAALGAKATVVESPEEADIVIAHVTAFNDAYDVLMEDAADYEKPVVLIFEGTVGRNGAQAEPYYEQVKTASAVLMQTYNNTPDHGSSVGSFYRYVTPSITAEMLFGEKEPAGTLVFEVPYDGMDTRLAWGELQNDIGVDAKTRLFMAMTVKEDPSVELPRNLGDVLFTADYGMSYAKPAEIEASLLTVPEVINEVTTETNGRVRTSYVKENQVQKAGVPFEIDFVLRNNGGAGHVTVQVKDGENVIAEKFVALAEGQWRVISMDITLDAGEHVIDVCGLTTTITAE